MDQSLPRVLRSFSKFVLDVMPAACAGAIGLALFTQYQFSQVAEANPPVSQTRPAGAAMMQLVHDEHALLADALDARLAVEKSRIVAERAATARAVAAAAEAAQAAQAAKVAQAAAAMRRVADAGSGSRIGLPRSKPQAVRPSEPAGAPLVIAQQAEPRPAAPERPSGIRAKTVEIADNVVAGTRKVAAAIVSIPTWIVSLGERLGRPPARNPEQEGRFASMQ